jgi:hypothetical protein
MKSLVHLFEVGTVVYDRDFLCHYLILRIEKHHITVFSSPYNPYGHEAERMPRSYFERFSDMMEIVRQ